MPETNLSSRSHQKTGAEFALSDHDLATRDTVFRPQLLNGQRVVVSGGGSGIGKATAMLFARLGADVAICGRRQQLLDDTVALIKETIGRDVVTRALDIRETDDVSAFIDSVYDDLGGIDVLINNAGGQFAQHAADISRKGWMAVVDTNLHGTWWMMQAAAKRWIAAAVPGNIINVVGFVERGIPQAAHTCAARAGVIYASKTAAVEWAPHDVRVNCLAPGPVKSEGLRQYPEEHLKNFTNAVPLKRMSDPFEMAETMVYMASPAAAFMTGSLVVLDGGLALGEAIWPLGRPPE